MRRIRSVLAAAVLVLSTVLLAPSGAAAAGSAGLTFTGRGAARHPGGLSVTLSGTYSCGPFTGGVPDRGVVDLTVSQTVDGVVVNGYGYLYPTACDGAVRRYAVEVTTFGEQGFRRGAAQWSGSGYVEGDGGMQHGYVPPTPIQIR